MSNKKVKTNIAFIQVRMESKRMPGKNLKNICGHPMLDWVIYGVKKSIKLDRFGLDNFGLVIPDTKESSILKERYSHKCYVYSGHHYNVLDRFYNALFDYEKQFNVKIDNVVRITADCPLLAYYSNLIDETLSHHHFHCCDFTHNRHVAAYPSGIDVEVMTRDVLIESWQKVNLIKGCLSNEKINKYKEHVTLYAKEIMFDKLIFGNLATGLGSFNLKWSIDDIESFNRVEDLIKFHILNLGHVLKKEMGVSKSEGI